MDEYDIEELKAQDRHERLYRLKMMEHPDCRDPDHPGCKKCEDEDE